MPKVRPVSLENSSRQLPHILSSQENKGKTYLTYLQVIEDTIEELKDTYITKLLDMNVFSSTQSAEDYFQKMKCQWIKNVELTGTAESKPLTPYELYLRKLKEENGEPIYRTDRAADFIHKRLSPSDYNSIAMNTNSLQMTPSERIMNSYEILQFGKPPKFLPATKKDTRDPAQSQEERHNSVVSQSSSERRRIHPSPPPMAHSPTTKQHLSSARHKINNISKPQASQQSTRIINCNSSSGHSPNNGDRHESSHIVQNHNSTKITQVDGNDGDISFEVKEESMSDESDDEINELLISENNEPNYLVSHYKVKPRNGKHKWKMTLLKAILHLDGKDELFSSIEADLQW